MKNEFAPVKSGERIQLLDVLRGFAIFGILMVNLPMMYQPAIHILMGPQSDASTTHIIAESFIKFFFEGKFYVIFSLLFGYGFWIFMNKSVEGSKSIIPVYRRRLFFLLMFGALHVVLMWAGDILVFYALFGFVLLLFRRSSDKKIFRWAVAFAIIPSLLTLMMWLSFSYFSQIPEVKTEMGNNILESREYMLALFNRAEAVNSGSNFKEIVLVRMEEYQNLLPGLLFFYPVVMSMFLIGFLAGRKSMLSRYGDHLPVFRKIFWWGLVIGILSNIIYAVSYRYTGMGDMTHWVFLNTTMHTIGGISLGLCYISSFVLLFSANKAAKITSVFAPAGRMALTNYIMHSLIAVILFHGYGFGLFGKIEVWQGIVITILIFTAQIFLSSWWLSRHKYGPLEFLWRMLTYGKTKI